MRYSKAIANDSEKALMLLSSGGDAHAFTHLFHLYKHRLYGFLIKLTRSPQMTEDIIQDIFVKIWDKREHLTGIENFGSYLIRMAQNYAINAFKKTAAETLAISKLQPITNDNSTDSYLNEKETSALLHKAISQLSTQQKLIYTLSREEGLKYEEIARRLGLSPSTVKNHMLAALHALRESFAANADTMHTILLFIVCLYFF